MAGNALSGVIFDKDGTLFDFQATWGAFAGAFLRELSGGDAVLFEVLAEAAGYDPASGRLRSHSVIVAETPPEIADVLIPYLTNPPSRMELADRMNAAASHVPMQPAVPLAPLLDGLIGQGLILGIATNDGEAPARAHLEANGILDRFRFVAGYASGHGGKPAPGQLLAFCRHVGLPPASVVMVGDSTHDLMAGRAAGMATVGVLTGLASHADLAPLADVVMPDIGALPAWLAGR
jgi:phosphoglycolate phosphatase